MPSDLNRLIAQAKAEVGRDSALVQLCQKRVAKFKSKHGIAKHLRDRSKKLHKPLKVKLYEGRMQRSARKIAFWTKREADAIELARSAKKTLARLLRKKAALQPHGALLVAKAREYLGTNEGSALQRRWASNLGYSSYLPWCSIFVANMLIESGICHESELPENPAYSGAWIGWDRGRRVNVSERRPGDLLIFDWGDGGLTDHVAICESAGVHIGGNQSNEVNEAPTPVGNLVAVIRPI